jgi:hypothetical protein
MSDIKNFLDIVEEYSEEEALVEAQDSFDIELGEDLLIETGVLDITEDSILVEGDEETLRLLAEHGLILEETDWSKYDEPTVSRIAKGVTKPVDRTDYDTPPAMRDPDQGKPGFEKRKSRIMKGLEKVGEGSADEPVHPDMDSDDKRFDDIDEAKYQGREVPLGKPMAGDVKKKKVYVKKPNGKVVKVNFGDKKMRIKKSNPARRKSFRARHNCKNPGPRWKARYWSCRAW